MVLAYWWVGPRPGGSWAGASLLMCWLAPDKADCRAAVVLGLVTTDSGWIWGPGDFRASTRLLVGKVWSWGLWLQGPGVPELVSAHW